MTSSPPLRAGSLQIPVQRLPNGDGLPFPSYATEGAAGLDLCAAVVEPLVLVPLGRAAIPTGFALALPMGYEGQIRPRSGLALREGITVLNSPGTIDADYRGELKVLLVNLGSTSYRIERGMRIAQLVIAPVTTIIWHPVPILPETARAAGGFGSTGIAATEKHDRVSSPTPTNVAPSAQRQS